MLSTVDGLDLRAGWFPQIVAERFLESTKDGEIKRAPDPVTMIDGDLTWFNDTDSAYRLVVQVLRAPRSIVAQNPSTVVIHDAWTWAVGFDPVADYPSVVQDACGGRVQVDRGSVASADLQFGRFFLDSDNSQCWVDVGTVAAGESLHFRYLAAVQTPGVWTTPSEFDGMWEASARWTRLLAYTLSAQV